MPAIIQPDEFDKDVEKEKAFLAEVLKFDFKAAKIGEPETPNQSGVTNELALMIRVYNEQLERLIRLRFDSAVFNSLIIAEPNVREHLDNKTKADGALRHLRRAVAIEREQIVKMINSLTK